MTGLAAARADVTQARLLLQSAMQNARIAALEAHRDGTPETVIAREIGVDRMTIRKWLGK
jgi:hypothetical protein